ncbi:MAG: ParB/RepB/Spo0J family partition protein, partial [Paracraurococcus sp.]
RPVDPAYVELLASTMAVLGADTPVTIGAAGADGRHPLIAGGHRMAAARALGWTKVSAIVSEATGDAAKLLEIDENLMRRELSALDRAVFLAERQAIYARLNPETVRGKKPRGLGTKSSSFPNATFTKATAERLGLSERSIQMAVRRAALPAEIRGLLVGHPVADSGAELDKLLGLNPDEQAAVAQALTRAEKPAKSVSVALLEFRGAPKESRAAVTAREFNALLGAWRKAGTAARRQFAEYLAREGVTLPAAGGEA